jgi:hypothetical protein
MNYIEKLHWYTIEKSRVFDNIYDGNKYIAKNSAEITENISILFAKWLNTEECLDLIHDMNIVGEDTSIENLFQEFLKTKQ